MLDFSAPTRQNAFKKIKSMMIAKKRNVFKISNVVGKSKRQNANYFEFFNEMSTEKNKNYFFRKYRNF